ncbi:hypothetical protein NEPAR06_0259 [Nematocida parisii]|nr:hypothetical protein NEPAR03_0487 [Nematocida parisii]KAI5126485.1 hypothetical protein NEPAR08_0476 [Nematocida parisii]KAI5140690.1 hypothetical protein NEPAR04_0425 [Nematocida parisii]KAI5142933.1 hypothetical protein NEPAR07_0387 [Nematocida parisii]KAI5153209.1 hypothetical protein NEPAR06_0259 [Nematocida parisii]
MQEKSEKSEKMKEKMVHAEGSEKERELSADDLGLCKELLLKLKKSPHAGPFLYPVDPQVLNIPDYYEKIKQPMDLSTISKNLETGIYKSTEDIKADIELMLQNCYTYNQPDTAVSKMGQALEKYFKQLLQKGALDKKRKAEEERNEREKKRKIRSVMTDEEYTKCLDALNEIVKAKYRRINWPFLEPVDETLVPNYYTLITYPMDLGTMRTKLTTHQYAGVDEFMNDFDAMISNCYSFNAEGTDVYVCATKINTQFKQIFEQKKKKPEDSASRIAVLRGLITQYETELRKLEEKAGTETIEYGYEEKLKLKRRIESLAPSKLRPLIVYIQENIPHVMLDEMESLEVNLDALDQKSLRGLSNIVREAYVEEQRVESDSSSE